MNEAAILAPFMIFYVIFLIAMIGLSIWAFVLFIKVSRRGIKALDIYLAEKEIKKQDELNMNNNQTPQ